MNELEKHFLQPLLDAFKMEVLAARERGGTQQEINEALDKMEGLANETVHDAELRAWLIREFREVAKPPHEGTGTVQ